MLVFVIVVLLGVDGLHVDFVGDVPGVRMLGRVGSGVGSVVDVTLVDMFGVGFGDVFSAGGPAG